MTLIKHPTQTPFAVLRHRLRVEIIFWLYLKFNNVSREQGGDGGGLGWGGRLFLDYIPKTTLLRLEAHNAWRAAVKSLHSETECMKCCSRLCSSLAGKTGINNVCGGII